MKKGKKGIIIGMILLVILGIVGGIALKTIFYGRDGEKTISNKEANRLIRYLSIHDYVYSERLGSSFTISSAKELLKAAGVSEDAVDLSLKGKPGFMPLTRTQFESLYDDLIEKLELNRLSRRDLYIFDINKADEEEIDGIMYALISTNEGNYYMEKDYGMDSSYIGKAVRTYVSNNEIILCLGESDGEVTIPNVYVTKVAVDGETKILHGYAGGKMRELPISKKADIKESQKAGLYDVTISNVGVDCLTNLSGELMEKKVLSYADGALLLDGMDTPVYLSDTFYLYRTKGGFKVSSSAGTLVGYEKVNLYIKDNMVEAAVLEEDIYEKNIRVLINNAGYAGYFHDKVIVMSQDSFTVSYGEKVDSYDAGEKVEFRNGSKELEKGNAVIESENPDGKITLVGLQRQCGDPSYRGKIELSKRDEGVVVVNELPVEEYLYGVVPSEMPISYNLEALKAQAICARAYACRQLESESYAEYGAHLDDSVASQVYNNVEEDEWGIYAVDDTYGVVPCYKDEVIEAFFFSTSCGTTSNNCVVWGGIQEPYLLDTFENELNDIANLENEESFQSFINGELGSGFFEETEPFYRWHVSFSTEQMTTAINSHLYERIQAMPENILVLNAQGEYEKKNLQSIGDVVSISVTKRGKSGIIEELQIVGTQETILVKGQGNVRALFSPEKTVIYKQDGSTITGWDSLPSAYFYIETTDGLFTLKGGGFGHGVGMSQNGANRMAAAGYSATDIIEHYYTAVELKDMYELMGK